MTSRPTILEHLAVQPLLPYLQEYAIKGLHELKSQQSRGKFNATEKEIYAAQVMERVDALDSSIRSLRLAMNFILDLDKDHSDAAYLYRKRAVIPLLKILV